MMKEIHTTLGLRIQMDTDPVSYVKSLHFHEECPPLSRAEYVRRVDKAGQEQDYYRYEKKNLPLLRLNGLTQ